MTILVTGANGFVGHHLVSLLSRQGHRVLATGHQDLPMNNPRVEFHAADLMNPDELRGLPLADIDAVIHLAGLAAVGPSFDDPELYLRTNVGMQQNLYDACVAARVKPRMLIVSSGSLYDPSDPMPISEQSGVRASSPYAESKIRQEKLGEQYEKDGFEYIIARPFNHVGPGQRTGFIVADLAKQIVEAEKGDAKTILVGNLDARRDYTDVRDIVRAYASLITDGVSGETYNICSGRSLSGHQILQGLLRHSHKRLEPVQDPAKMRPVDIPDIYGDNSKIAADTGWQPEIDIDQTLADTLDFWRS